MSPAKPASTPVSPSKSAALSRALDLVTRGYSRYITGTCPAHKAIGLAQKFHDKYGVGCSPAQRITRKHKGLANAALVMHWAGYAGSRDEPDLVSGAAPMLVPDLSTNQEPTLGTPAHPQSTLAVSCNSTKKIPDSVPEVAWALLVTEGGGPVTEQEELGSVFGHRRLSWLGYELVRLPKRGGTCWTWRRSKSEMADWYALLGDQLAHRKQSAVAETLRLIAQQPGFAGVRSQSWELIQFARSRGYSGEVPFLFHLQKICHGISLRLG